MDKLHNTYIKGQGSLEYAILIAVIVAGLIGMQVYVKRGMMGRLRLGYESIGAPYIPKHTHTGKAGVNGGFIGVRSIIDSDSSDDVTVDRNILASNGQFIRRINSVSTQDTSEIGRETVTINKGEGLFE